MPHKTKSIFSTLLHYAFKTYDLKLRNRLGNPYNYLFGNVIFAVPSMRVDEEEENKKC